MKKVVHDKINYECYKCDYSTNIQASLVNHQSLTQSCFRYVCNICEYKTSMRKCLNSHTKNHTKESIKIVRSEDEILYCKNCDYNSKDRSKFEKHLGTAFACYKFKCNFCSFKTSIQTTIILHKKTDHPNAKIFQCEECDYRSEWSYKVSQHYEVKHEGLLHRCSKCDFKTSYRENLLRHFKEGDIAHKAMLQKTKDQFEYPCNICKFSLVGKSKYKTHMILHSTEKDDKSTQFRCTMCKYTSDTDVDIRQHVEKHGKMRYECSHCQVNFGRVDTLKVHIETKHLVQDKGILSCQSCAYKTARKDAMKRHIEAIHEMKRHQCLLCAYSGYERGNLKQHIIRKHPELVSQTDEKVSSCQICEYKTVRKASLRAHMLKHENNIKKEVEVVKVEVVEFLTKDIQK